MHVDMEGYKIDGLDGWKALHSSLLIFQINLKSFQKSFQVGKSFQVLKLSFQVEVSP